MKKVGFIGTGVMGSAMARNLMRHGFVLTVFTRSKEKAQPLLQEGAAWASSAGACTQGQDAVVTMVGYPQDVEQAYFAQDGILSCVQPGMVLIDCTTTSPKLSQRIYEAAKKQGAFALDAPVSGGDSGAKQGTLSIMVGGDSEAFDRCAPIFAAMGTQIVYEGGAGTGQHTKMANQIAIAGAVSGVFEAIAYGRAAGLDISTMLSSISKGAAGSWQMEHMAPRALRGDLDPGFFIKHYIKDMRIAKEEANERSLDLHMLSCVLSMYEELEQRGMGNLGTQALVSYYDAPAADAFGKE